MLTNPPEVCRPRGGFFFAFFALNPAAPYVPDWGQPKAQNSVAGRYVPTNQESVSPSAWSWLQKQPGRRASAEDLFASYLEACAGLSFTEIRGASSVHQGGAPQPSPAADYRLSEPLSSFKRPEATFSRKSRERAAQSRRAARVRPASGRWRVRLGGRARERAEDSERAALGTVLRGC
jgi:hypothetical protein